MTDPEDIQLGIFVGVDHRSIRYMAELPPEANVLQMTVMANAMPFIGRG